MGPMGRLYQIDMRLRPTGKSGSLVIPLAEFRRYYEGGGAQLWERQSLTRARVIHGDGAFAEEVMQVVAEGAYGLPWRPAMADEIRDMRERIETNRRSERDVKRNAGGLIDVEFLVQLFQMKYGKSLPMVRSPNTWRTLDLLLEAELIDTADHGVLLSGYDFLRRVEGRLRIVHNRSLDELPDNADELEKLARRLGWESGDDGSAGKRFLKRLEQHTSQTRLAFLKLVHRERNAPGGPVTEG
jgi:glutamate-ammonia-ligase adenylyltransferase